MLAGAHRIRSCLSDANVPAACACLHVQQMTYVKQLEAYEEAVMKKRVDEMTESELAELAGEVDAEKLRKQQKRQ